MNAELLSSLTPSVGIATGIRARLSNPSSRRRREWCFVSVPYGAIAADEAVFVTDRGLRLRAVACEDLGEHSTIWRVFAPFGAMQDLDGEFVIPSDPIYHGPFALHPWTGDAPMKLIPHIEIRVGGTTYRSGGRDQLFDELSLEFRNACMMRWRFRTRVGTSGFVFEGSVTFFHMSPVADVRAGLVWSTPSVAAHDFVVDSIFFLSGEPVRFDFSHVNGMSDMPVHNGSEWVSLVSTRIGLIDGSGFPLIGRMLCFPDTSVPVYDPGSYNDGDHAAEFAQDVETLAASADLPVLGLAAPGVWDGRFLAHRNGIRFTRQSEQTDAEADAKMTKFLSSDLSQVLGMYATRPIGCSKTPGQTGDQQDFGAQKGWEATTAGDPRWLFYALYSVTSDFFRGFMLYEADGTRLDPRAHPNMVTWSMWNHFSRSVSPDRRGKVDVTFGIRESTGWVGYDEEHRSQNNLAAVYALTGDPLLRFIIEHASTADSMNVRFRKSAGTGAPRAIGRQLQCWANFMLLFDARSATRKIYSDLIADVAVQMRRSWYGDRFAGPVDIISDRTDPRMGITFSGVTMPAWSCWEHALAVVGMYAAWKVTRDPFLLSAVQRISRTIVRYATFVENGKWFFCATCHWPKSGVGPTDATEGNPMPNEFYSTRSTLVTTESGGGVSTWTVNAVLIFIETHAEDDADMGRAKSISAEFAPNATWGDARTAEWQACVRSVPVVADGYLNY